MNSLDDIAGGFDAIAAGIKDHKSTVQIIGLMTDTWQQCGVGARDGATADAISLLSNLQTALTTWQEVWPRLGARKEFRQAVGREAAMWSKRLRAMATEAKRT